MSEREPIAGRLGCVVLIEPRDGGPSRSRHLPTGKAMELARECQQRPDLYRRVVVANVFRIVEVEE